MFGHETSDKSNHCQGILLALLGGALTAAVFFAWRHACKKAEHQERLGQAPSREHIRMSP